MTYIFDMSPERVLIATEWAEWKERFPTNGDHENKDGALVEGWRSGTRKLSPEHLPKLLRPRKPRSSWPDMFKTNNGLLVVRQTAKDIIEGLDPDLHQFFPLEITTKRGLDIAGPWFAMNVTAKQDSIDLNHSTIFMSERAPDRLNDISYEAKWVTVDASKQSGIHLWREKRFKMSLLGSDALVDALKAADLNFFPGFKAQNL